jgi:UDP-3-O-[3-hydroxymyristoyl] glucosamine N-acyltransferase
MQKLNCEEISTLLDGEIVGNCDCDISSLAQIEKAGKGQLTFYYDSKYENYFINSEASCIIVDNNCNVLPKMNQAFIKVDSPYSKFVKLLKFIESKENSKSTGIHKSALFGSNCEINSNVMISANCVVGDNCKINAGAVLRPGVVLYDNVMIGKNTIINSNVTIYNDVIIGDNCIIHAGAIIGSDGFGYLENKEDGSFDKIPQIGNVVLEDYVEIGSNSTIDCALIGSTIIRKGTKIDNLVHIGHNCEIGENTGIAAQTGISGSVISGKGNRFGGQVGIAGHLEITDKVTILAQSGVSKSIKNAGVYFGSPIKEHLKAFKIEAVIRKLPELSYEIGDLKNQVNKLIEKIGG